MKHLPAPDEIARIRRDALLNRAVEAYKLNFQFVTNMGLVGEEKGAGSKYLFVPPGYDGAVPPDGYQVRQLKTNLFLVCARVPDPEPSHGLAFLRKLRMYPLSQSTDPQPNDFQDVPDRKLVANPCEVDGTFGFWQVIKRALDRDVLSSSYYQQYGMLADLGLRKDRPFEPDEQMTAILTEAAVRANEQLAVTAFASAAPERLVWPDRQWEWVAYSEGDDGYYERDFLHLSVRERWFYQATLETSKMFMHKEGAGSIYWLATVDTDGNALDGGQAYRLTIPAPVPASPPTFTA